MASRAIIIENYATSDQAVASAWTSRMQGIGSILGFLLGSLPRPEIKPRGFASEFSILCVLGSALLLISALVSAFYIKTDFDSVIADRQAAKDRSASFIKGLSAIPREIWQIFAIQFFAWLGWFPFRTYYTSWLAETYVINSPIRSNTADVELDLHSRAARLGSIAGLYLSITAFVANCVLPFAVTSLNKISNSNQIVRLPRKDPEPPTKAMLQVWIASHIYFAIIAFLAGRVGSQIGTVFMISSLGFSWAVTLWIPFCLIGIILSREQEDYLDRAAVGHQPPQLGLVVGLHNAAISVPQILSALICSFTFTTSGDTAEGTLMVLLSGGCWALVAAFVLWIFFVDLQRI
ncbi:hypothetical protein VTL71DRAFT_6825 [Oculimacula yallundae]|uniref:Uncharacterized protein n=1 Tax=Oculimacula yallundae TaxID=86028 RepID=A0ABR4BY06_9HELO